MDSLSQAEKVGMLTIIGLMIARNTYKAIKGSQPTTIDPCIIKFIPEPGSRDEKVLVMESLLADFPGILDAQQNPMKRKTFTYHHYEVYEKVGIDIAYQKSLIKALFVIWENKVFVKTLSEHYAKERELLSAQQHEELAKLRIKFGVRKSQEFFAFVERAFTFLRIGHDGLKRMQDPVERNTLQEEFSKRIRVCCNRVLQAGDDIYEYNPVGRIPEGFLTKEDVKASINAKIQLEQKQLDACEKYSGGVTQIEKEALIKDLMEFRSTVEYNMFKESGYQQHYLNANIYYWINYDFDLNKAFLDETFANMKPEVIRQVQQAYAQQQRA